MNILIFGISNVGKTTIGKKIAEKLQYEFVDIDDEIKKYYGYQSILEFVCSNPYQVYRDQKRGYMIELQIRQPGNRVIAVPPLYYTRYYTAYLNRAVSEVVRIELIDSPENIFERLIFTDDNDNEYTDNDYKMSHRDYYIKEIKKEMTAFKAAFSKIENKVYIDGLNVEEAANLVIIQCGLRKGEDLTT